MRSAWCANIMDDLLYPRAIKFTRSVGARGHIRAINLANHNDREYKNGMVLLSLDSKMDHYMDYGLVIFHD